MENQPRHVRKFTDFEQTGQEIVSKEGSKERKEMNNRYTSQSYMEQGYGDPYRSIQLGVYCRSYNQTEQGRCGYQLTRQARRRGMCGQGHGISSTSRGCFGTERREYYRGIWLGYGRKGAGRGSTTWEVVKDQRSLLHGCISCSFRCRWLLH